MDRLIAMQVFERVAEEGGFAAAGRALDISAPVVTRLIAELEAHLGTRLLQRTTRRVSLTDAGQAYLSRVRHILQDVQEAEAIASADTGELTGRLRVQTPPVLATYVIAPCLYEFRRRYPHIVIEVEVVAGRVLPVEDFDITLMGTDASFDADIVARKVVESDVILAASPAYLHRRGLPLVPEDLAEHECLRLRHTEGAPHPWRLWCDAQPDKAVKVDVAPVLTANHTDTLLRAALDGAGITSVSIDIVAPYLMRGELVRVLSPWIAGRLGMYAALPSRKFIPRRSHVFLDFLIDHTREQNHQVLQACGTAA